MTKMIKSVVLFFFVFLVGFANAQTENECGLCKDSVDDPGKVFFIDIDRYRTTEDHAEATTSTLPSFPVDITDTVLSEFTFTGHVTLRLQVEVDAPSPLRDGDRVTCTATFTVIDISSPDYDFFVDIKPSYGAVSVVDSPPEDNPAYGGWVHEDRLDSVGDTFVATKEFDFAFDNTLGTNTGRRFSIEVGAWRYTQGPSFGIVGNWCCETAPANDPGPCVSVEPPITEPGGPGTGCGSPAGEECGSAGDTAFVPVNELTTSGLIVDYFSGEADDTGCSSCSGGGARGSQINGLQISRRLVPGNQVTIGNGGPGVFFGFDHRLTVCFDEDGPNNAMLFDACIEKTLLFNDDDSDLVFEPSLGTYFEPFALVDNNGNAISDFAAAIGGPDPVFVQVERRNGWLYKFELTKTPLESQGTLGDPDFSGEFAGRLIETVQPNGFKTAFTYDMSYTQADIDQSPARQLQIETITDELGNTASVDYLPSEMAGRWVIGSIDINSGETVLTYHYDSPEERLSEVKRDGQVISSYTYTVATNIQAAKINWTENLRGETGESGSIYLSSDYMTWNDDIVNQVANYLLARADGSGYRYMSVSRAPNASGLYRVEYRGRLIQWQRGGFWRYFTSYQVNGPGYDGYEGTMESVFAHHPNASSEQMIVAQPLTMVSETGLTTTQEYDDSGNPTITHFPWDGGSFEKRNYDGKNQVWYSRDRGGFVTLTQRDENNNVVRIIRGLEDSTGDGQADGTGITAHPETTQEIFGYYGQADQNPGMLKWMAVTPFDGNFDQSAIVAPPEAERADYVYHPDNRLQFVYKPIPNGQSTRPKVTYAWSNNRVSQVINERNHPTNFEYDDFGRLKMTTYPDNSTEQILRDTATRTVYRKDRNDIVSQTKYDTSGRMLSRVESYATDADLFDGSNFDAIVPASQRTLAVYSHPAGRMQPSTVTRNGTTTAYVYDYRNRQVQTESKAHNNAASFVRNKTAYHPNNLVFYTERESNGYSSRNYTAYSADQEEVRKVACRTSATTFVDNEALLNLDRDLVVDPDFTVVDAVRDVRGNLTLLLDEYGTKTFSEFDALGRQIRQTQGFQSSSPMLSETAYNEDGNVTSQSDPRGGVTVSTYDPAGNVKTRSISIGGLEQATTFEYDIDGRQKKTILPTNGFVENFYVDCCGRSMATKDLFGDGTITNMDHGGRTIHQATVENYDPTTMNLLAPDDDKTLRESTTRYGANGRVQFRTVWSQPLSGAIDPQAPPIAGVDEPLENGVTTQYVYFLSLIHI